MSEGLQSILHDAYVKERKLNLLYSALAELDGVTDADSFPGKACDEQDGSLQVLLEINEKYGNKDIDPGIIEKLGEGVLQIKSGHSSREELMKLILDYENELVEDYKKSLRFLTADDQTRRLVNKMLTVKLVHKRDLLDKLNQ
jgi:hypothetical protein